MRKSLLACTAFMALQLAGPPNAFNDLGAASFPVLGGIAYAKAPATGVAVVSTVSELKEAVADPTVDEVRVRGVLEFDAEDSLMIGRSVVIRGDEPDGATVIGGTWTFRVFAPGSDVVISDIHFEDCERGAILAGLVENLTIENNVITADNGRSVTYQNPYDELIAWGMLIGYSSYPQGLTGDIVIRGNFVDLELDPNSEAFFPTWANPDDPFSRPLLGWQGDPPPPPPEYYITIGIDVRQAVNNVVIKGNHVRNGTGRGILCLDWYDTTTITIKDNLVEADAYGGYHFGSRGYSSYGIFAFNPFNGTGSGGYLTIKDNDIRMEQVNHVGIGVGNRNAKPNGASIKGNRIHVTNGYLAIVNYENDDFEIKGNTITGSAYFGIAIDGLAIAGQGADRNVVKGNDMAGFVPKATDDYLELRLEAPYSAHVLLTDETHYNEVLIGAGEVVVDQADPSTNEVRTE
ncbi:MAG: right-handed parallel beta-helix repeat-containing protein [Deltaproteobacteria bacterium]|nr:right-handed parallel beta-helix repeat-containing protein [Deltaproteobacteria bacterium]